MAKLFGGRAARKLILPLTKGPQARWGSKTRQDWYRGLQKAKEIFDQNSGSKIWIISDVQVAGCEPEADTYLRALREMGVDDAFIVYRRECQETIRQLNFAARAAREAGLSIVLISTWLHYPRVRWICRRDKIPVEKHIVAWGIPRPGEAIRDVLLWVAFPLLDICGLREWYLARVESKRRSGEH